MRHRSALAVSIFFLSVFCGVSEIQAGWTHNGAPICTNAGVQEGPRILPDGEGGAFIVWNDSRTLTDIYAQRVDEMGRAQWAVDGIAVCHEVSWQYRVRIAPDGAGGFIAAWIDSRVETEYDIYAQRVDAVGDMLWTANGVAVCTAADDQDWPVICSDGEGGCIIAWVDERNSNVNDDIYAQRLDADGVPLWTAGGVAVCTADSVQFEVQIVEDGSGGAVISWTDYRDDGDIYAQRLDPLGAELWTAGGAPVCNIQGYEQYQHKIATDGAGGAFAAWCDRQGNSLDIRVQRINSSGSIVFTPAGVVVCNAYDTQRHPVITDDGSGGAIVAWEDFRNGSNNCDIYAHRIDSAGGFVWTEPNGEPVCNSENNLYDLAIMSDSDGGAIIAWADLRDAAATSWDVYAQRIGGGGACLWHADGDSICKALRSESQIVLATDGHGGAIIAWRDDRTMDNNIYAHRITDTGDFVATTLSSFDCSRTGSAVRIEWSVSEAREVSDFVVARQVSRTGDFLDMAGRPVSPDGFRFAFEDGSTEPGAEYSYRVYIMEDTGRRTLFETGPVPVPGAPLELRQNVPNPFNPATRIAWYLDERSHVTIEVFDTAGRRVATLLDGTRGAGDHEVTWNGAGADGRQAASGIYLYRLTAGKRTLTRKMVLLR